MSSSPYQLETLMDAPTKKPVKSKIEANNSSAQTGKGSKGGETSEESSGNTGVNVLRAA